MLACGRRCRYFVTQAKRIKPTARPRAEPSRSSIQVDRPRPVDFIRRGIET